MSHRRICGGGKVWRWSAKRPPRFGDEIMRWRASSCSNARKNRNTRSSAVAVIADRTAYDVRYTGKRSNRFRLQV